MGIGWGESFKKEPSAEELSRAAEAEAARIRAEGGTPLGETPVRAQAPYAAPTQTSQYANPIPQYMPSRFDATPYGQAYQQQFGQMMPQFGQSLPPVQSLPPLQAPQAQAPLSGLGALAQLYSIYNAAPQTAEGQGAHAASLAAAANTPI